VTTKFIKTNNHCEKQFHLKKCLKKKKFVIINKKTFKKKKLKGNPSPEINTEKRRKTSI